MQLGFTYLKNGYKIQFSLHKLKNHPSNHWSTHEFPAVDLEGMFQVGVFGQRLLDFSTSPGLKSRDGFLLSLIV